MKHSDTLDKLAPALVKARAKMGPVHKDSSNPHFKNSYASMAAISAAATPALLDQGIVVIQGGGAADEAGTEILTRLLHTSGEWIETAVRMPLDKPTAQGAGSALTYGKRYGLAAALGIVADEDDDGNAASAGGSRSASSGDAPAGSRTAPPRRPTPSKGDGGVQCPKCGGAMWDNRESKKSPKHPDYKCKDKDCKDERGYTTAIWDSDLEKTPAGGFEDFPEALQGDDGPMPWDE